jgi:hypothetical protein
MHSNLDAICNCAESHGRVDENVRLPDSCPNTGRTPDNIRPIGGPIRRCEATGEILLGGNCYAGLCFASCFGWHTSADQTRGGELRAGGEHPCDPRAVDWVADADSVGA